MNENNVKKLGWFASLLTIIMFISNIDQIRLNMSGHPGSIVLPVLMTANCVVWGLYACLGAKKDWPLIICNIPGFILSFITAYTAIFPTIA